jgi:Bacteriophage minor capsid protein
MSVGDGWTSRLLAGMAEQLAAAGVGAWRPDGAYAADEVGILVRAIPTSPDRIVTLAAYPVSAEVGLAEITTGVQVRIRGTTDPRTCDDLADHVFDLLDSAANLSWGGIPVVQVYRQSYASLGTDTAGRWQASHNYYVDAMRTTSNRL